NYTTRESNRTRVRATRPMHVSRTVQVRKVCWTVRLKLSFTSQKPPSFTWEQNNDPAPIAITSNSLLRPGVLAATGARIADAIVMATVAEPTATRIDAATIQPSKSGET